MEPADEDMFATSNLSIGGFDVKCFRLVSRQLPAALDRYLVTMRPLESTRWQSVHAVLPSTAGKLHVESLQR